MQLTPYPRYHADRSPTLWLQDPPRPSKTVDWPKARLGAGDCTRTILARELCKREDWRNAKGEPCLASARAAFPKLSAALGLPLPEAWRMEGVSAKSLAPSPDNPEGDAACPGGRIRYWIRSSVHGVLGGLAAGAGSWHHKARDLHIGWSQEAQDANIGRVVNNGRFLLLPGVRVHGVASQWH